MFNNHNSNNDYISCVYVNIDYEKNEDGTNSKNRIIKRRKGKIIDILMNKNEIKFIVALEDTSIVCCNNDEIFISDFNILNHTQ